MRCAAAKATTVPAVPTSTINANGTIATQRRRIHRVVNHTVAARPVRPVMG